jgi:hypothetical protein
MIGDPTNSTWPDDQTLQDVLDDDHQSVWRNLPLQMTETRAAGTIKFQDFYSVSRAGGNWESDAVLVDAGYQVIDSSKYVADFTVGHWAFTDQPAYPVYITGKTFDLNGAAADLLEREAASQRKKFDTAETGGASAKRSQIVSNILTLASKYRAKQRPKTSKPVRSDTVSGIASDTASSYQAAIERPFV